MTNTFYDLIEINTYSNFIFRFFLDLCRHKQLIINAMAVIRLVKSRNPEPVIIGHDDDSSLTLQSFDFEFGFTDDVITLTDDNVDDSFLSLSNDVVPSLTYVVKEMKQF